MKKLYLLAVTLFYALSIFSAENPEAYKGTKGLGYSFNKEMKTATLTGRGTAQNKKIVVPQKVQWEGEDYQVVSIGEMAFSHDLNLTSIVLPEGMYTIGPAAFDSCINLNNCDLSSTIEAIFNYAFHNCKHLTSISIPNNLSSSGRDAFSGTAISAPLYNDKCFIYMPRSYEGRYSIKEGTIGIGGGAFEDCVNLYGITIPNSVKWIGEGAFAACTSLTDVVIPNDSIQYLGNALFGKCTSLRSVKLPDGLVEISPVLFMDCSNLKSVNIPVSVEYIGPAAFSGCKQLDNISLPKKLRGIDTWAFAECENLNQLTLPKSVGYVGDGAFDGCHRFTEPVFNDSVFAYMPAAFKGTHYTIKNGIKRIAGWAFYHCENLEIVSVPNSVDEAGTCSVAGGIIDVPIYNKNIFLLMPPNYKGSYIIPDGIKTIAPGAFLGCKTMTNIIIPTSVTEIGTQAFEGCYSLRRVEVPNKDIITVAADAFPDNCTIVWK